MFWILHNDYGFGKKRLAKFMRQINDFCVDYIGPGEDGQRKAAAGEFSGITLQDIADQLAEECGIKINTKTWEIQAKDVEVVKVGE